MRENLEPTSHFQALMVLKETREQLGILEPRDHKAQKEIRDAMDLRHQGWSTFDGEDYMSYWGADSLQR